MLCEQAARHTHSMRSRLADLVDLLLGWSLEPDLPHSTRYPHMRALMRSCCTPLFCIVSSTPADTLPGLFLLALLMRAAPLPRKVNNIC